ncbi:MAG TPA: NAD(P)H-dependent glycerol-3-phosphate dehydrogenase [bacterium]|nr:NAD(P)H-dependent glycerol-3-phosphate dehydrogenase [bacterium]
MSATQAPVGIVGSGEFGTSLAWLLAMNGHQVILYTRSPDKKECINATRHNSDAFPDLTLPSLITASNDLAELMHNCSLLLLTVPAAAMPDLLAEMYKIASTPCPLVSGCKGFMPSGERISTFAEKLFGDQLPFAVLSGPNFAAEIIRQVPTISVAASKHPALVATLQPILGNRFFRVYGSDDLAGVELGGILKNVLAIAAGIHDGLQLGHNSRAALITRGMHEMSSLATRLGARESTLMGISGLGDAILSCTSSLSRNYRLGTALSRGATIEQALREINSTVEGIATAPLVLEIAEKYGLDLPITSAVQSIISGSVKPAEAIAALMTRPWKYE